MYASFQLLRIRLRLLSHLLFHSAPQVSLYSTFTLCSRVIFLRERKGTRRKEKYCRVSEFFLGEKGKEIKKISCSRVFKGRGEIRKENLMNFPSKTFFPDLKRFGRIISFLFSPFLTIFLPFPFSSSFRLFSFLSFHVKSREHTSSDCLILHTYGVNLRLSLESTPLLVIDNAYRWLCLITLTFKSEIRD